MVESPRLRAREVGRLGLDSVVDVDVTLDDEEVTCVTVGCSADDCMEPVTLAVGAGADVETGGAVDWELLEEQQQQSSSLALLLLLLVVLVL